jgi:hypothetical protein
MATKKFVLGVGETLMKIIKGDSSMNYYPYAIRAYPGYLSGYTLITFFTELVLLFD